MPTIYFVRHGSTEANRQGLTRSWGKFGLDSAGTMAAKNIGKMLAGKGITAIHSSDLQRAKETAGHIAEATGAKVQHSDNLRTWNLGRLSGKKIGSVIPQLNFHSAKPHVPTPEGESFQQFFERSSVHLKKVIAGLKPDQAVAIVGHGRHMNGLDALMKSVRGEKVDLSKIPVTGGPGPGSVVKLTLGKDGVKRETLLAGDKQSGVPS
ncbi:MAG TPA: histidine phosphatase family protein [Candidatus Angelobacter sp.]|nr:histidine phosphatase family protein [Candidatus Angelobacter sp.]